MLIAAVAVIAFAGAHTIFGQQAGSVGLQGVIKSASGAPVAGAFVKMINAERRLTFMVVSQDQGRYSMRNLPAGKYTVQGIGGENQSAVSAPVDVAAGRATTVDVSLTDMRAPALPAAWPFREPGGGGGEAEEGGGRQINLPDGAGKQIVLTKCSVCHDAARIASARYDRARWQETIEDMKLYIEGASSAPKLTPAEEQTLLDYVATNFTEGGSGRPARRQVDPNSRLPRTLMTGLQRKYIAVEYVLPNPRVEPHEVASDRMGSGWVTQRTGGKLGRLDPVTYEYTEIAPPAGPSDKVRLNGIVTAPDGKLWFVDGGPNRRFLNLEPRTREFNQFPLPKLDSGSASGNTMRVHPNGTVWLNSIAANEVIRLDPKTRKFDVFEVPAGEARKPRGAVPYGMAIDGDGFVWSVLQGPNAMTRIDPNSGQFRDFPIPVQGAVARKAGSDSKGDVYAGLHGAGKLLKIDHKTFEMTVFDPPTKNAGVYSVQGDPKSKYVWMSEQHVDQIARFDPDTKTFVEFPLPTAEEDHRRIDVDQNNSNRIWWSGNLTGRMGYIELIP
jgi:virginiamycin B lyase